MAGPGQPLLGLPFLWRGMRGCGPGADGGSLTVCLVPSYPTGCRLPRWPLQELGLIFNNDTWLSRSALPHHGPQDP